jgi:hypothetical protein
MRGIGAHDSDWVWLEKTNPMPGGTMSERVGTGSIPRFFGDFFRRVGENREVDRFGWTEAWKFPEEQVRALVGTGSILHFFGIFLVGDMWMTIGWVG